MDCTLHSGSLKVISHLSAWLMLFDIILDILTTLKYKAEFEDNSLPSWYWHLGVLFVLLPGLVLIICGDCYILCALPGGGGDSLCYALMILALLCALYSLLVPVCVIFVNGYALFTGKKEEYGTNFAVSSFVMKLPALLFESLPQLALSWIYLGNRGMPWGMEKQDIWTWLPLLSNISSTLMIVNCIGSVIVNKLYKRETWKIPDAFKDTSTVSA